MSNIEPENQFDSEEELRALLERWQPPERSESLDKRVSSSYLREMNQAGVLTDSLSLAKTHNEVVTMKFCSRCQEDFADKFSFCPVDGTPLTVVEAQPDETSITVSPINSNGLFRTEEPQADFAAEAYPAAAAATSAAGTSLVPRGEYHLTI